MTWEMITIYPVSKPAVIYLGKLIQNERTLEDFGVNCRLILKEFLKKKNSLQGVCSDSAG